MLCPEQHTEIRPIRPASLDRRAWEVKMIAEARAELEAGLLVDGAEVDAWIDSLGTDHELPVPSSRR